jgi:hypothetical protein
MPHKNSEYLTKSWAAFLSGLYVVGNATATLGSPRYNNFLHRPEPKLIE